MGGGHRQGVEQELVRKVWPLDRHAEPFAEFVSSGGVIDMAMGEEDLLHGHALFRDGRLNPVEVAAGIHDGADLGGVVPNQRAVLLEGRDRDDPGAGRSWHGGGLVGDRKVAPSNAPERRPHPARAWPERTSPCPGG